MDGQFINTTEAAKELGVSVRRVRALIEEGKLKADKLGRDYIIAKADLATAVVYGKRGRPRTRPKAE